MKLHVKEWLQLGRAQTWSATFLLIMIPFLTGDYSLIQMAIISAFTWLIHLASFAHNSLMDAAMMYDQKDPHKKHHPLISGAISLSRAHNVIHWGLAGLTVACAIITVFWSCNVGWAMVCLMIWVSFGHAYNDGLSKESLFGFLAISLCMTAMGGWGLFLSNRDLNPAGLVYLFYVFFCILYQISWSGFVKEMQLRERSNILSKLGARLDVNWKGEKIFIPGKAALYPCLVKGTGLILGLSLCWLNHSPVRLVITVLFITGILYLLHQTIQTRIYKRGRELLKMSIMEILTIYLIIPLMLNPATAAILMMIGVAYFFGVNLILWSKPYPKV